MPHPSLIPLPASVVRGGGRLSTFAPPSGPPEILALLTAYPDAPPTGDFRLTPGLGAEGYRLTVDDSGVSVAASTPAGLRWAVQTLRQLYAEGSLPHIDVTDAPRYGYRGALLDVARWCHPIGFVRRFVDLMAGYKLNTLHLHLTDDQGWRFDVPGWPRLAEVGAHRAESSVGHRRDGRFDGVPHGGSYTRAELRDLVAYAAARGITVMPEIDLPGHMQAAIAAYPELGNEPGRRLPVRTSWGISTHILNCAPATLAFARDVLDEVVDIFPSEVIHLGGDEVPPDEWAASPDAKAVAEAAGLPGVEALSGWWIRRMAGHLATHGRRVAGWDELVDAGVPADTTIFSWRDRSRVEAALTAGHPVVAVPQEYTYLDWPEVDSPDEPIGIPNGFLPLDRVYGFDPGPVLGLQGQLWSEYVPVPAAVEWRAFPRLAAIAEVGWSGPGGDFAGFRERVAGQTARWDAIGLNYRPLD